MKKASEVIYRTGNSIKSYNNDGLLSLMLRPKFVTTSGPLFLRSWHSDVSVMNIRCQNINAIKTSVGEVYVDTLRRDNSCMDIIIRFGHMEYCINIVGLPNEVHLHIRQHMTRHIVMHWQRLLPTFQNVKKIETCFIFLMIYLLHKSFLFFLSRAYAFLTVVGIPMPYLCVHLLI